MKHIRVTALALAIALYCTTAFAQHGQMGGSMNGGMGHGAASHSMNSGNSSGSTHGMTMDQQLSKKTKLAGKIETLTGMSSAQQACDGFKNLGQCVAAAHVSKNLGINFSCLKADMTGMAPAKGSNCTMGTAVPSGTTGKTMSLGKAIQTLSPTVNASAQAKKAQKQADQDLKASSNS
jgi:hypothetical protein